MMKLVAAAILGFAGLLTAISADAEVMRCDTCTTDTHFKEWAKTLGVGTHQLYNLHAGILQQWHVPQGGIVPAGTPQAAPSGVPQKQTPAPAIQAEFDAARNVYTIGGNTLRPIINVPVTELDLPTSFIHEKTVYDLVHDQNLQAMLESAAGSSDVISRVTSSSLLTALADLVSLSTSALGLKNQAALIFRIEMSDGSTVHLRVHLDYPTAEYLEDTARTAGGQLIPVHEHEVQGTWHNTTGDDLQRMADHMGNLGATVQYSGPSGGVVRSIVCTRDGAITVCIAEKVIY